jgi:hypothetical protein
MGYLFTGGYEWCRGGEGALRACRIPDLILLANSKVLQDFKWRTMS